MIRCIKCNDVSGIAKAGKVREKQRYYCNHCNYYFTLNTKKDYKEKKIKHPPTILDIAKQMKISKSTVSRALRNSNEIKIETKNAVLELARKINYVPNYLASSLVKRKSYAIGIVVPELITNFFSQFIIAAQETASSAGYEVVICHSNESFNNESDVVKRLYAYQVDGILLSISRETTNLDHLKRFENAGIPVILFNRALKTSKFPKVLVDDYQSFSWSRAFNKKWI